MVIKNKNGTLYKLSGPSPIMKQQDLWGDFILHNFDEVILHNFDQPVEKPKKKYQPLNEIAPQEIEVKIKETPVPAEQKIKKKKKGIIVIYCMPAITQNGHDPLYNENRVSISYGPQFSLETIVINSTDLVLQIWTRKEIAKNSILYFPNTRRWWKVENINQKEGFIIDCTPSSIQPSFTS